MSETGDILAESVGRLFTDLITREVLAEAENDRWPEALWGAIEDNGLGLAATAEAAGGIGAGWADCFAILHAAGRHAAPVPLAETILAGWLLGGAGIEVPAGPLTVAPVTGADEIRLDAAAGRLSGRAAAVPWGRRAGHAAVRASSNAGPVLALVTLDSVRVEPDRNIAREPRDTLVFEATPVIAQAALDGDGDALRRHGAMLRAGQMAGALSRLLDESVQYATDRVQFGRPIAKFQAVQQQLATLAEQASLANVAAEAAFRAADKGEARIEIAAAKIVAGEAADAATAIAHQVHGAIGFTYEHQLHFLTRRLWSWRAEFGTGAGWAEVLGRRVAARGAAAYWPDITARG